MASSVRIAVVGDVICFQIFSSLLQFLDATITYLHLLALPGDFGNENVELVRSIVDLKLSKAAILGNHDAWRTQQFAQRQVIYVEVSDYLGEEHVGYRRVDYPSLKLSIVGGRPFSCGGEHLFRKALLDASAKRIYEAALGAPEDHSVILLAHNGPTGLGSKINDICGRDWVFGGGDHGDPGSTLLAQVLARLDFLFPVEDTVRAFTLVEISGGKLQKIAETWVSVTGDETSLQEEHILYRREHAGTENPMQ
ncbi:hypothetical protein C3L33_05472, partial [Rhododendron williamsianum]